MALQEKHYQQAERIHDYVQSVLKNDGSDAQILENMFGYMKGFKEIMDQSVGSELDALCMRYPGFLRFANVLENLAKGIEQGEIDVPGGEARN